MNINLEFDTHDIDLCQELIAYVENMKFKTFNKDFLLKEIKEEIELLKMMHVQELSRQILEKIGKNGFN